MNIRLIRSEELPHLMKLYESFFYPDDPKLTGNGLAEQKLWKEICSDPKLRYYVVEVDETLVSTCTLTLIPNLVHGLRPYGLIENVATSPGHRKCGYGTAVLRHALEDAWKEGCYKVMLATGSKKEETLRFYEKAGFKRGIKTGFIALPYRKEKVETESV